MSASVHTSGSAHRSAPTDPSAAPRRGRPATRRRRLALAAVAASAALVLTACGGGDDSADEKSSASASQTASADSSAEAGEHNAADVTFAQGMIPHHRQAVEMADMAAEQAGSPEVKKLAAKIKKAQDPEIRTLTAWLKSWKESVPEPDADGGSGHGSGHEGMSGMMTEADMEKLAKAKGEEFDTAFLTLMIEHHEGAVEMAKQQLAKGAYPPAKEMAEAIDASQSDEIAEMHRLLGHDASPAPSDEPAPSGQPQEQEGHEQQH